MSTPDTDRYEWTCKTVRDLRAGDVNNVDLSAVADYLDEMSRSDAREVSSRVVRIIEHRLKLDYVAGQTLELNQRGWKVTVREQQSELRAIFKESPSLRRTLTPELLEFAYREACDIVAEPYDINPPADCPYTIADLLDNSPRRSYRRSSNHRNE
jgi:hypothetical protein